MTSRDYLSELFSLDGLTALVTGGSSGIGRAVAGALARAGASVVVVARKEPELAATVDELTAGGARAAWVSGDLSTRDGVRTAAEDAVAVFGEPDILVNSAGINLRPPMGELDEDVWDATMAVNLEAPHLLGRRFGPGMAERGYGRIIHITSQQAHRAFVNSGAYGVSKGALESLARSQAEAWSPYGVTCNTLVPGFVMTPLNARLSCDPEKVAALAARTMVGRNGLAGDFAGAAVFLAGRSSGYVTGQSVFVDGGFSVH
ncbi:SDR family oxidoreductase [Streptomyces bobili]|uniref:SDR family NAD(P)-dependent oxidoreductase n=1 Tax=Streptomyces bobili TaxID=67280 RepID=UPI0033D07641